MDGKRLAAWDFVSTVGKLAAAGQHDPFVVKAESPQYPVRHDMFVVKGNRTWGSAAVKARIPLDHVAQEPLGAVEEDSPMFILDRSVLCHSKRHGVPVSPY